MLTVHMKLEKETKGAVRYQEVTPDGNPVIGIENAIMGTQYLRKSGIKHLAVNGHFPATLTITINVP